MAEQRVSNERKKELEQIDPFQASLLKAMAYLRENKKQLLWILGAIIVVCVTFSGIMLSFKKSENTASDRVAKASVQAAGIDDPKRRFEAVNKEFEAVLADYSNTSAGRMAKVKFAKICFDAGEYDKAFELYKDALEKFKGEAGMKNFLLASLGHASQAKNDLDKAKSYFLEIETGASALLKDEARFALASLYEAGDDLDSSLKMYEKIVKDHENSIYRDIAQSKVTGTN